MFEFLKIVHFVSLGVGVGVGVGNTVLGIRAEAAEGPVIGALRATQGVLSRVGLVAIIFLWITGVWMLRGYHSEPTGTIFLAKIGAVVILTGLSIDLNLRGARAAKGGTPMNPEYAKRAGMVMGLMTLFAISAAVLTFG